MIIRSTIVLSIIRFIIIYSKIYGSEGMESRLGNIFAYGRQVYLEISQKTL